MKGDLYWKYASPVEICVDKTNGSFGKFYSFDEVFPAEAAHEKVFLCTAARVAMMCEPLCDFPGFSWIWEFFFMLGL